MKKIFVIFLAAAALTMCAGQNSAPEPGDMPAGSFDSEDYEKLLALQFDGYEDMTVSDFQNRVWALTDTEEYRELLEDFSKNEIFYEQRDEGGMAAFFFYVLEPLTAEKWKTRDYSGYAATDFPYPEENSMLEYSFTLTVLNAAALTVREYNTTRLNIISGMQELLSDRTREELRDESAMLAAIRSGTESLAGQLQTEAIGISIDYAYFPLTSPDSDDERSDPHSAGEEEMRRFSHGTEADYRSLLALKTAYYQDMPLADFNMALLEWANENHERMERIGEDTVWDDFQAALTGEELSFVKLTVYLSGMENGKHVQSSYTGRAEEDPVYCEELPQKLADEGNMAAWCSLYYCFSYHVSDKNAVTVGERDRQAEGMINAVRTFWGDADVESLLKMSEDDLVKELEKIASRCSTDKITITATEEQVQFECMDERGYDSERIHPNCRIGRL